MAKNYAPSLKPRNPRQKSFFYNNNKTNYPTTLRQQQFITHKNSGKRTSKSLMTSTSKNLFYFSQVNTTEEGSHLP